MPLASGLLYEPKVLAVFSGRLGAAALSTVFAAAAGVAGPLTSGQLYRYPLGACVVEGALFSTGSGNTDSVTATLWRNGVATALALTLPAGGVGQVVSGAGSFAFDAADTLDIILVTGGALAADFVWSITLRGRLL